MWSTQGTMIMNDVLLLRFTRKMLENGCQQWGTSVDAEPEIHSFLLTTFGIYSFLYFRGMYSQHPTPRSLSSASLQSGNQRDDMPSSLAS